MTKLKIDQLPASPIERLDQQIGEKVRRLSKGTASAQDVSEATRLIRKRADQMMPEVFRRLRSERLGKSYG
jgi:hypothetical protein